MEAVPPTIPQPSPIIASVRRCTSSLNGTRQESLSCLRSELRNLQRVAGSSGCRWCICPGLAPCVHSRVRWQRRGHLPQRFLLIFSSLYFRCMGRISSCVFPALKRQKICPDLQMLVTRRVVHNMTSKLSTSRTQFQIGTEEIGFP